MKWNFSLTRLIPLVFLTFLGSLGWSIHCQEALHVGRAIAHPYALLPNHQFVPPTNFEGGYHGNHQIAPEIALVLGLPPGGANWNLLDHVVGSPQSAFRGSTAIVSDPIRETGAAYWAGENGWVYEIRQVPTWDVNVLLEGRVPTGEGFANNPYHGENELAIPARISPEKIKRWGMVYRSRSGILYVKKWTLNPKFKEE